jgi:predicted RNA-binding Zn ribbon-like protein
MWEWLGDALPIDFANTIHRRAAEDLDMLRDGGDLAEWARRQHGQVPVPSAGAAQARLAEVRELRDDVRALLHAAEAGEPLPADARHHVNDRARALPLVAQLGERPGERRLLPATAADEIDELLAGVAAATIELVGSGAPLAFCDAPSCGGFFTPTRANQRWCGDACGTRARVARHAARHGRHERRRADAR